LLKEITVTGKTVEAALEAAAQMSGRKPEELQYEVIEQAKKGFLGIGNTDAKIAVKYEESPLDRAKAFLATFISDIGFEDIEISSETLEDGDILFNLSGDNLGLVIGRHGEILDALQYLTNLAANRQENEFVRILVDIENYRERRVETLQALAHKIAQRVLRTGRNVSLEPMNSYERRIIHSEVQNIEGVITFSVGSGDDRKIIMAPENAKARKGSDQGKGGRKGRSARSNKPSFSDNSEAKAYAPSVSESIDEDTSEEPIKETVQSPKKEKKYDPDAYRKNATVVAGAAPKVYEYNPVRQPQQIKKAKSIEELGLADVEDTEEVLIKK